MVYLAACHSSFFCAVHWAGLHTRVLKSAPKATEVAAVVDAVVLDIFFAGSLGEKYFVHQQIAHL